MTITTPSLPTGVTLLSWPGNSHFRAFISDASATNYCPYLPNSTAKQTYSNRQKLATALGVDAVACVKQVHGNTLVFCRHTKKANANLPQADAIATDSPKLAVSVFTADCVPVLLCSQKLVVAIHAGRRGLAENIIAATLLQLATTLPDYPLQTLHWRALIGPCICAKCYEIDTFTAQTCLAKGFQPSNVYIKHTNVWCCDLRKETVAQLTHCGIFDVSHIDECVRCNQRWPSHRRGDTGRMISGIWRLCE